MKTQLKLLTCVAFLVSTLLPMDAVALGIVNVRVVPGDAGTIAARNAAMNRETAADANAPDTEEPQAADAENTQEPSDKSLASDDADQSNAADESDADDDANESNDADAAGTEDEADDALDGDDE